jgi:hypothetical protein
LCQSDQSTEFKIENLQKLETFSSYHGGNDARTQPADW